MDNTDKTSLSPGSTLDPSAGPALGHAAGSAPHPDRRSRKILALSALVVGLLAVAGYFWMRSESAPNLAWMAWTKPTAIFFITILCLLVAMSLWEAISPGSGPRVGILRIETTRGDRLFLSLLGSAFINLAWLGWVGPDLWKAMGVCLVYAVLVFTLV